MVRARGATWTRRGAAGLRRARRTAASDMAVCGARGMVVVRGQEEASVLAGADMAAVVPAAGNMAARACMTAALDCAAPVPATCSTTPAICHAPRPIRRPPRQSSSKHLRAGEAVIRCGELLADPRTVTFSSDEAAATDSGHDHDDGLNVTCGDVGKR